MLFRNLCFFAQVSGLSPYFFVAFFAAGFVSASFAEVFVDFLTSLVSGASAFGALFFSPSSSSSNFSLTKILPQYSQTIILLLPSIPICLSVFILLNQQPHAP